MTGRRKIAAIAIATVLLWAPAGAQVPTSPACDPTVMTALQNASAYGTQQSLNRIRNQFSPHQSLLDLSCFSMILNALNGVNLLFDPQALIMAILQQLIYAACAALQQEISTVTQQFSPSNFFAGTPGMPSYGLTPQYGNYFGGSPNAPDVTIGAPSLSSLGVNTPSVSVPSIPTTVAVPQVLPSVGVQSPSLGTIFSK